MSCPCTSTHSKAWCMLCWPAAVILLRAPRRLPALIGWLVIAQGVTHLIREPPPASAGLRPC